MSSADDLCKQFGHRSGPTECKAWSGSKLLDTLMVFLKEFFKNVDFEKKSAVDKYRVAKELTIKALMCCGVVIFVVHIKNPNIERSCKSTSF